MKSVKISPYPSTSTYPRPISKLPLLHSFITYAVMGLLTTIRKQKIKDHEIRVLLLGLDNAGKTTIVRNLLHQDTSTIAPTMGFQINTVAHKGYNLNVWDVGGQSLLRSFWSNYFDAASIVVWVIDGLNVGRLVESYHELRAKVIVQDQLVDTYLAVLINKADLLSAEEQVSVRKQVEEALNLLAELAPGKYTVEVVSGLTGMGLEAAADWMVERDV